MFIYLDILVASISRAEDLETLFEHLNQSSLIMNTAKCQFGLPVMDFLGHRIRRDGAIPVPSKVAAVADFPCSCTTKALQEFLGMVKLPSVHPPRGIPHAAHEETFISL